MATPVVAPDTGETARPSRSRSSAGTKSAVLAVLIFIVIVTGWQVLATSGAVSPLLLAPPVDVLAALGQMVSDGTLWPHLSATVQETVFGFLLAVAAALVIGSAFAYSPIVRNAVYPYILVSQTFPKVAIAPLIVAIFGYDLAPKVVLAALLAFFPVLTNTMAGLTEVSDDEVNLFRSLRASKWQELRHLRIPNALAFIFPALNSAAVLALIGAIVGEFVASRTGIGYAIQQFTTTGEVAATYAALIVLSIVGLTFYGLLTLTERLVRRNR
ncbi:NitT/TauT family transport system permease protein [Tamaricihabitans halophyticus]|uniref:NitT/TauT family transport system permease protein n=1 Tax=Tamaricihabitans halophyticus TaxID=1262583 RepID=A0A4R2QAE7_9PSEU|nr:ABC transporter permease [Tamaricihabitans halophyticus]TCP45058.1 NitT/TauT family transport system permease protein [Tamaricihabitans halophyticus]